MVNMKAEEKFLKEGLTFDDVLLVPAESDVLPADIDLHTKLTKTITLNTPVLAAPMMTPAMITPSETAAAVDLIPILRKDAARVPVHAPVPGSGMPTNSISATNRPPRPARPVSFRPPASPFSRQ